MRLIRTQNDWYNIGLERGYCTEMVCSQHDGTPFTEEEANAVEDGDDPCVFVVRILDYDSVHDDHA